MSLMSAADSEASSPPPPAVEPDASPRATLGLLCAFYFFNYGALGALFPFLPLLLSARELSAAQIAHVLVLVPLFNLLAPYLWGSLADAFQARGALLRLASFACAAATLLLWPAHSYAALLGAVALLSFFRAPLAALADAAANAAMGPEAFRFGRVRLWGSIGFAVCVVGMGQLGGSTRPALLVGLTAAIYLLAGLTTFWLPAASLQRRRGIWRETRRWLAEPAVLPFLLGIACYYAGHAVYDAYYSLRLAAAGQSDAFVGQAWAIGVGAEVLLMLASPRLLLRYRPARLLIVSSAASTLRWIGIATATTPLALLALQPLHCLTFGLWYLSMVRQVQLSAPEHLRTSLQGVAHTTFGLGAVLGYLGGGEAIGRWSTSGAFALAALGPAAALGLFVITGRSEQRRT